MSIVEYVPDPGFDNAAAWSFAGTGASIADSQLKFINATIFSSATIPLIVPVVGVAYDYSIVVERYPSPITARILFGGVEIYNKHGVGTFTDTVTPISTTGLVFLATLSGQWFLDSLSITRTFADPPDPVIYVSASKIQRKYKLHPQHDMLKKGDTRK